MKNTIKTIAVLAAFILAFSAFICTPAAADTEDDASLSVTKNGDVMSVSLVANKELVLGGFVFQFTYDSEHFSYTAGNIVTGLSNEVLENTNQHKAEFAAMHSTTVSAGETIFTINFDVIGGLTAGTNYTFSVNFIEAYDYDFDPLSFEGSVLTVNYAGPVAPSVEFNVIELRTRGTSDSNDGSALRVMYKVSFNDSFVNYKETEYGVSGENNYEITRFAVSFTRTDSANPVTHLYDCSNIYSMAEGWFLYNVTLTGIKERHASWQFKTFAEIDYKLGDGDPVTVNCNETVFTINDYVFNAD